MHSTTPFFENLGEQHPLPGPSTPGCQPGSCLAHGRTLHTGPPGHVFASHHRAFQAAGDQRMGSYLVWMSNGHLNWTGWTVWFSLFDVQNFFVYELLVWWVSIGYVLRRSFSSWGLQDLQDQCLVIPRYLQWFQDPVCSTPQTWRCRE